MPTNITLKYGGLIFTYFLHNATMAASPIAAKTTP
jgi:hypothetical protein